MVSRSDGSAARLYDLTTDAQINRDVAGSTPDVVDRIWNDYVLKDAGGPLPKYGNERPF